MKERGPFLHLDKMVDASRLAASFVDGMSKEEFLSDERTRSAVAMQLLIIGEAAGKLDREHREFLGKYPLGPWIHMIGMRNRIAHGYYDLEFDIIYGTALIDAPELLKQLRAIYIAEGEPIIDPAAKKRNDD